MLSTIGLKESVIRIQILEVSISSDVKVPRHYIRTGEVVRAKKGWRFNSATNRSARGKKKKSSRTDILIQTFEGPKAKQRWERTLRFARHLVNAHFLDIVGTSPTSASQAEPHYIVFDGVAKRDTRRLIASMLRKGERETTAQGLRTIQGIASGLDYLTNVRPSFSIDNVGFEHFDVFSDDRGCIKLSFTPDCPESAIADAWTTPTSSKALSPTTSSILDSLITKIFNDANHIIYREKLDRHNGSSQDQDVEDEDIFVPITSNVFDVEVSNTSIDNVQSSGNCRREIIWRPSTSERKLSYISETYSDLLLSHCSSYLDENGQLQILVPLPRRSGRSRLTTLHKCKGYLREEVTFTPDAYRNAIMVFEKPSQDEVCVICGQTVPVDEPSDYTEDKLQNHRAASLNLSLPSSNNPDSSSDLSTPGSVAHFLDLHNIPKSVPQPPYISSDSKMLQGQSMAEFEALCRNYLSMLANNLTNDGLSPASDNIFPTQPPEFMRKEGEPVYRLPESSPYADLPTSPLLAIDWDDLLTSPLSDSIGTPIIDEFEWPDGLFIGNDDVLNVALTSSG
ncbi:uncharacterized protein C8R40DRAFT_1170615 [Lentinula edodes]|uniref:uncharacterized protein n=1 Tax=Lentinula edodes TaxID=5353 RepID=UPI001E8CFE98|nr:uncharacterized protein C8R40DRAFT_1170615 [Lentinula edodes]KAH7875518.1 hypothetical protein C8R40DRAFT_1170615 [Lentinula edodes]